MENKGVMIVENTFKDCVIFYPERRQDIARFCHIMECSFPLKVQAKLIVGEELIVVFDVIENVKK